MQKSRKWQVSLVVIGGLALVWPAPAVLSLFQHTVAVPEFSISVKLSGTAEKQLENMQESVLVIAYFDGDPLPGQGKDNSPFRGVFLGSDEKLLDAKKVAMFNSTRISQRDWVRLPNKDYFVTINVVSARKVSTNNLLDCGAAEDRISKFAGRATNIFCRLIGERDATTR